MKILLKKYSHHLPLNLLCLMGIFLLSTTVFCQTKDVTFYTQLADAEPQKAMICISDWRDEPFAPGLMEKLAKKNSSLVLQYNRFFEHTPYHDKTIEIAVRRAVHTDPSFVLCNSKWFIDQPWAKEIIEYAGRRKPFVFISLVEDFENQAWAPDLINETVHMAPASLLFKYRKSPIGRDEFVHKLLGNSQDTVIQIVLTITSDSSYTLEDKQKMLALLQNMVYNHLSLEDAGVLVRDPVLLLRTLVEIHNQPEFLARYSVENVMADICVHEAVDINDLHENSPQIRFASIKNYTALELYILMVYSEKEIYTSTFNGLFDRFLQKMKKEKKTGDQQVQEIRFNKFKIFVKQMAYYNRLNDFMSTMSEPVQKELLEFVVKDIEKDEEFLAQAVTVAEVFGIVQDSQYTNILRETLNHENQRVSKTPENREGNLIYEILTRMFVEGEPINDQWIERVTREYNINHPLGIPAEILFPYGVNIQQYFFYDDKDGHNSFQSFLKQYANQSIWNVEQDEKYVHISSVGKDKQIEIYANNPGMVTDGTVAIDSIFHERKIVPVVIVHRGHSYHVDKTLEKITNETRIVYLGSCGGYYSVEAILRRAPLAQIITTKGSANAFVNDPLLKLLNEQLYNQNSIDWPSFWIMAGNQFGDNDSFKDYVSPDKNLAVLFLKIYFKQLQGIQNWN